MRIRKKRRKINQRKEKQAKGDAEDLDQDHLVLTPQNTVERKDIIDLIEILEGEDILHLKAVKKDKQKGNK